MSSLPEELLLHIFSFLPCSSLITVWKNFTQWRDLSRGLLAARIQSSLADSGYKLNDDELDIAAHLVTKGYLSNVGKKILATRIQLSWSRIEQERYGVLPSYGVSVAEMQCAAALAATGHLTSVECMVLEDLKLPSIEDMPRLHSLTRIVRDTLNLRNVTGDIAPLLSSLTCTQLLTTWSWTRWPPVVGSAR